MSALIDSRAVMYTSGVAEPPDVPDEMRIVDARSQLGPIIEKSRYFDGVTFLTYRGKRVAAIAPIDVVEAGLRALGRTTED